jgi:hypothetical protein
LDVLTADRVVDYSCGRMHPPAMIRVVGQVTRLYTDAISEEHGFTSR